MSKEKYCQYCNSIIDLENPYGKGLFCNKKCQLRYSWENNKEKALKTLSESRKLQRIKVIKKCKKCGKEFEVERTLSKDGIENIPKRERSCCSKFCAGSYSALHNKGKTKKIQCITCGRIVEVSNNITKIHCKECHKDYIYKKIYKCKICNKSIRKTKTGMCRNCLQTSKEGKQILSNNSKKSYKKLKKEGRHKGWKSRNIRSYPEEFFEQVLKNNNIFKKCIPEHIILKRDLGLDDPQNYFLDFYFPNKMIDLEIDGKQHEYLDRKESDKIRDKALKNNGIKVYRIKWKSINTDKGKKYIENEINKFLEFYYLQPEVR